MHFLFSIFVARILGLPALFVALWPAVFFVCLRWILHTGGNMRRENSIHETGEVDEESTGASSMPNE